MKRADIKATVEKHLAAIGVAKGQYLWQPQTAQLLVVIGEGFKAMTLKSGISQRDLMFALGRISGWLEMTAATKVDAAPEIQTTSRKSKAVRPNSTAHSPQVHAHA